MNTLWYWKKMIPELIVRFKTVELEYPISLPLQQIDKIKTFYAYGVLPLYTTLILNFPVYDKRKQWFYPYLTIKKRKNKVLKYIECCGYYAYDTNPVAPSRTTPYELFFTK